MRASVWCGLVSLALLAQGGKPLPVRDVLIGTQFFRLEVAATPATREHGLMERDNLAFDAGMLFVFPKEKELVFWMYNTRLDLDILFLDATGKVVDIQTMPTERPRKTSETEEEYEGRLPRYTSKAPAQFAIELKVGSAQMSGVKVGERVSLDLPALNRLVAGQRDEE
jgi:uncharacterized membrane protein (UPF0127 family)